MRCLLCKAFIRRARSTNCKRCGAMNVDTSIADMQYGWVTTTVPGVYVTASGGTVARYATRFHGNA